MSTFTLANDPLAVEVTVDDAMLRVILEDGRELSVPKDWFPRLRDATLTQR